MQVLHDTKDKNHFVLTISMHISNMIDEPKMNILIPENMWQLWLKSL